jgi:hypothetical protein
VRVAAAAAGRTPAVEALVQHVEVTDDASAAAVRIAPHIAGSTPAELIEAPFIWIGTPDEIARQVRAAQDRWDINRYVVRPNALAAALDVMQALQHA